jgi:hypothetical protein
MSAHNQTPQDKLSVVGHSHAASTRDESAHDSDAGSSTVSDKESSSASDTESGPASTTRRNIKWNVIDEFAPTITGNSKLKEVAQMCGLKRIKASSNAEYATFCCNNCDGFHRRAMWDAKVPKNDRNITIHVPSVPHMQGHTTTCARASDPWALTNTEVSDGTAMTIQGRNMIVGMLESGSLPEGIALAINKGRRNGLYDYNNWFKREVTAKMVSNIKQYEKKKSKTVSGAELAGLLNTNIGLENWCHSNSYEQESLCEVKQKLRDIGNAPDEPSRKDCVAKLRSDPMAKKLFVVATCKDNLGRIIGIAFTNSLICTNIEQCVRVLKPNNIHIAVDGTYELSKIGWTLCTTSTHSIGMTGPNLSHKCRPLVYVFGISESSLRLRCKTMELCVSAETSSMHWYVLTCLYGSMFVMDHLSSAQL